MSVTDLPAEGRATGWAHQRLTANEGRFQRDYFARDRETIEVHYDARGRIATAVRHYYRTPTAILMRHEHLGSGAADKRSKIVSWLQAPS